MRCDDLVELLPAELDDPTVLGDEASEHVAQCLRCQAHRAQYRRLRRDLGALRGSYVLPAAGEVEVLLDLLRPPAPVVRLHRRNSRIAYIGGIAAGAAAGAFVVGVRLAQRPRLAS